MFSSHSVEPALTEVSHPSHSGNACHETVEDLQIFNRSYLQDYLANVFALLTILEMRCFHFTETNRSQTTRVWVFFFVLFSAIVGLDLGTSGKISIMSVTPDTRQERLFQALSSNDCEETPEFLAESRLLTVLFKTGEICKRAIRIHCWEAEGWGWGQGHVSTANVSVP